VWFRDPTGLFSEFPVPHLMLGSDGMRTFLEPGNQGFEDCFIWRSGASLNTGAQRVCLSIAQHSCATCLYANLTVNGP
jgi:hypothetical protein